MPTYNRANYITYAIDSVLSQSYPNFELLVVDDGSTDNTKDIVTPYLEDPRVHYIYKENGGQSSGRNLGFKNSKGDYICFLDSDNVWFNNKLETCIEAAAKNPDYGVIYGNVLTIDEKGHVISKVSRDRHSGWITAQLLKDNFVTINTATIKRECYENMGGLDESFLRAPDYEFWLRLSTQYKFLYIPEHMAQYRIMKDQISTDKDGRFKANKEILDHFLELHPESVSNLQKRIGLSYYYNRKARYESSKRRPAMAIRDWANAVFYYPLSRAAWRFPARFLVDQLK